MQHVCMHKDQASWVQLPPQPPPQRTLPGCALPPNCIRAAKKLSVLGTLYRQLGLAPKNFANACATLRCKTCECCDCGIAKKVQDATNTKKHAFHVHEGSLCSHKLADIPKDRLITQKKPSASVGGGSPLPQKERPKTPLSVRQGMTST